MIYGIHMKHIEEKRTGPDSTTMTPTSPTTAMAMTPRSPLTVRRREVAPNARRRGRQQQQQQPQQSRELEERAAAAAASVTAHPAISVPFPLAIPPAAPSSTVEADTVALSTMFTPNDTAVTAPSSVDAAAAADPLSHLFKPSVPSFLSLLLHPSCHPALKSAKGAAIAQQRAREHLAQAQAIYGTNTRAWDEYAIPHRQRKVKQQTSSASPTRLPVPSADTLLAMRRLVFSDPSIQLRLLLLWVLAKPKRRSDQLMPFETFQALHQRLSKIRHATLSKAKERVQATGRSRSSSHSPSRQVDSADTLADRDWQHAWNALPTPSSVEFSSVQGLPVQRFLDVIFDHLIDLIAASRGLDAPISSRAPLPCLMSEPLGAARIRLPLPGMEYIKHCMDANIAALLERREQHEAEKADDAESESESEGNGTPAPDVVPPEARPTSTFRFRHLDQVNEMALQTMCVPARDDESPTDDDLSARSHENATTPAFPSSTTRTSSSAAEHNRSFVDEAIECVLLHPYSPYQRYLRKQAREAEEGRSRAPRTKPNKQSQSAAQPDSTVTAEATTAPTSGGTKQATEPTMQTKKLAVKEDDSNTMEHEDTVPNNGASPTTTATGEPMTPVEDVPITAPSIAATTPTVLLPTMASVPNELTGWDASEHGADEEASSPLMPMQTPHSSSSPATAFGSPITPPPKPKSAAKLRWKIVAEKFTPKRSKRTKKRTIRQTSKEGTNSNSVSRSSSMKKLTTAALAEQDKRSTIEAAEVTAENRALLAADPTNELLKNLKKLVDRDRADVDAHVASPMGTPSMSPTNSVASLWTKSKVSSRATSIQPSPASSRPTSASTAKDASGDNSVQSDETVDGTTNDPNDDVDAKVKDLFNQLQSASADSKGSALITRLVSEARAAHEQSNMSVDALPDFIRTPGASDGTDRRKPTRSRVQSRIQSRASSRAGSKRTSPATSKQVSRRPSFDAATLTPDATVAEPSLPTDGDSHPASASDSTDPSPLDTNTTSTPDIDASKGQSSQRGTALPKPHRVKKSRSPVRNEQGKIENRHSLAQTPNHQENVASIASTSSGRSSKEVRQRQQQRLDAVRLEMAQRKDEIRQQKAIREAMRQAELARKREIVRTSRRATAVASVASHNGAGKVTQQVLPFASSTVPKPLSRQDEDEDDLFAHLAKSSVPLYTAPTTDATQSTSVPAADSLASNSDTSRLNTQNERSEVPTQHGEEKAGAPASTGSSARNSLSKKELNMAKIELGSGSTSISTAPSTPRIDQLFPSTADQPATVSSTGPIVLDTIDTSMSRPAPPSEPKISPTINTQYQYKVVQTQKVSNTANHQHQHGSDDKHSNETFDEGVDDAQSLAKIKSPAIHSRVSAINQTSRNSEEKHQSSSMHHPHPPLGSRHDASSSAQHFHSWIELSKALDPSSNSPEQILRLQRLLQSLREDVHRSRGVLVEPSLATTRSESVDAEEVDSNVNASAQLPDPFGRRPHPRLFTSRFALPSRRVGQVLIKSAITNTKHHKPGRTRRNKNDKIQHDADEAEEMAHTEHASTGDGNVSKGMDTSDEKQQQTSQHSPDDDDFPKTTDRNIHPRFGPELGTVSSAVGYTNASITPLKQLKRQPMHPSVMGVTAAASSHIRNPSNQTDTSVARSNRETPASRRTRSQTLFAASLVEGAINNEQNASSRHSSLRRLPLENMNVASSETQSACASGYRAPTLPSHPSQPSTARPIRLSSSIAKTRIDWDRLAAKPLRAYSPTRMGMKAAKSGTVTPTHASDMSDPHQPSSRLQEDLLHYTLHSATSSPHSVVLPACLPIVSSPDVVAREVAWRRQFNMNCEMNHRPAYRLKDDEVFHALQRWDEKGQVECADGRRNGELSILASTWNLPAISRHESLGAGKRSRYEPFNGNLAIPALEDEYIQLAEDEKELQLAIEKGLVRPLTRGGRHMQEPDQIRPLQETHQDDVEQQPSNSNHSTSFTSHRYQGDAGRRRHDPLEWARFFKYPHLAAHAPLMQSLSARATSRSRSRSKSPSRSHSHSRSSMRPNGHLQQKGLLPRRTVNRINAAVRALARAKHAQAQQQQQQDVHGQISSSTSRLKPAPPIGPNKPDLRHHRSNSNSNSTVRSAPRAMALPASFASNQPQVADVKVDQTCSNSDATIAAVATGQTNARIASASPSQATEVDPDAPTPRRSRSRSPAAPSPPGSGSNKSRPASNAASHAPPSSSSQTSRRRSKRNSSRLSTTSINALLASIAASHPLPLQHVANGVGGNGVGGSAASRTPTPPNAYGLTPGHNRRWSALKGSSESRPSSSRVERLNVSFQDGKWAHESGESASGE